MLFHELLTYSLRIFRWEEEYVLNRTTPPYKYLKLILFLFPASPVLQRVAGKDASKQFWKYHNDGVLKKYRGRLQIGSLDTKKVASQPAPTPAPAPAPAPAANKQPAKVEEGSASPAPAPAPATALDPYGALIPFADPAWYHGVSLFC